MKKGVTAFIVAVTLIISIAGCNGASVSTPIAPSSSVTPSSSDFTPLTAADAIKILMALIDSDIVRFHYISGLDPTDGDGSIPSYIIYNSEGYFLTDHRLYKNIVDIKTATEAVFTKEFAEKELYPSAFKETTPTYIERNGRLYFSGMTRSNVPSIVPSTLTIENQTADTLNLQVYRYFVHDNSAQIYPLSLKKENGKWLLNSSINTDYLTPISGSVDDMIATGKVTGIVRVADENSVLNVKSSPSTTAEIIATLKKGEQVTITEITGRVNISPWLKIKTSDGKEGYVNEWNVNWRWR